MDFEVKFANTQQRNFYYATARNQVFSGGFNNGKSFGGCLKALTLLLTFPNYRFIIARQVRADLMKTTYQTFFKICPKEIIDRNNEQEGITIFKNGSQVYWLHLDKVEESTLRGIEPNSYLVDQAEETDERVFDVLDARLGRWDNAIVPDSLLSSQVNWPLSKMGKPIVPSYGLLLCNPDTQYHYLYRRFHPDSLEREKNVFFTEGEWDPDLGSSETYIKALEKGEEWVQKYVRGKWGISDAQIHQLPSSSLLDFSEDLLVDIKRKGNLFRILDHGDASPTCCLWVAAYRGVYVFFREYYVPNQVISYHRRAIFDLSVGESYSANYADPSIFSKASQKNGGFWSVADEYLTKDIPAPSIAWIPADNNEFATRNRINELLRVVGSHVHPITGEPGPGIYFLKKSIEYPQGCFHAINQLQAQRRKLLGYIDGKSVYCDDREDVVDHAYDPVRYFVAMHGRDQSEPSRPLKKMTFKWYQHLRKRQKNLLVAGSQVV